MILINVNNNNMKKILQALQIAIAQMRESANEKISLSQREAKANEEIKSAAADGKVDSEKVQNKISRASATITVCRARREHIDAGLAEEVKAVWETYMEARSLWNKAVAVRREITRSEFLTANLRFFSNSEQDAANRLSGIITHPMAPLARAGWNGCFCSNENRTPEFTLGEIEAFLNHVNRYSEASGIPID